MLANGLSGLGIISSECDDLKCPILLVGSNDDACTGDFTVEKFETRWIGTLTKESLAVSDSNRKNLKAQFLDKIIL